MKAPRAVPLDTLPVPRDTQRQLKRTRGVEGCLYVDGFVVVFGPGCEMKTEAAALEAYHGAPLIWRRSDLPIAPTRVSQALHLMDQEGLTAYAAAKLVGVSVAAVYRGRKRHAAGMLCPTCGQPLIRRKA